LKQHPALHLFLLVLVVTGSGASCPRRGRPVAQSAPVVFGGTPTIQEAIDAVNANTASVRQLQTDTATLSLQGMPSLRASIALQQPRDFRLRASLIGMGQVLDMGSNDQVFWALVDAPQFATNMPRAVYFARHDQFRQSAARHLLPIQPHWLIEAFGVVRLDPSAVYEGPYARAPGQMEIRARTYSPDGDITKVIVLDDRFAWILEQHWYDWRGQLIASVVSGDHQYDSTFRVSLPHHIEVRLVPPQDSFQIDVERYAINQLYSDPAQLWAMPDFQGYQRVDLAGPSQDVLPESPPYGQPAYVPTAQMPPSDFPHTGYRPQYRGYTANR
jgi:hypothetical protein